jgi:hypothetical protein
MVTWVEVTMREVVYNVIVLRPSEYGLAVAMVQQSD